MGDGGGWGRYVGHADDIALRVDGRTRGRFVQVVWSHLHGDIAAELAGFVRLLAGFHVQYLRVGSSQAVAVGTVFWGGCHVGKRSIPTRRLPLTLAPCPDILSACLVSVSSRQRVGGRSAGWNSRQAGGVSLIGFFLPLLFLLLAGLPPAEPAHDAQPEDDGSEQHTPDDTEDDGMQGNLCLAPSTCNSSKSVCTCCTDTRGAPYAISFFLVANH